MDTKKAPEGAERRRKGNKNYAQLEKTKSAFFQKPCTMMEVAKNTGIERANICRYVSKLRKCDNIWLVNIGRCPITGHKKVGNLTTNPKFAPKNIQLELF
ncbi:MAG: hypothetical protein LBT56_00575 [Prevotellaceae bacterium]|jgi:hypothetical protein|nr:hypothetical protein [Prevotellaceae bacterium]